MESLKRDIEVNSLSKFLNRYRLNEVEFKKISIRAFVAQSKRDLAEMRKIMEKQIEVPSILLDENTDFWELTNYCSETRDKVDLDEFLSVADNLPINEPFINALLTKNHIVGRFTNAQKIQHALKAVEHLNLFDLEFNAHTGDIKRNGKKYVCIYPHLNQVINFFSDLVLGNILTFDRRQSRLDFIDEKQIKRSSHSPIFLSSMMSIYSCLFGREYIFMGYENTTLTHKYPDLLYHLTLMRESAKKFVKYHEYAHILLGHEPEQKFESEIEADTFAFCCLEFQDEKIHEQLRSCKYFGIAILFDILNFIEDVTISSKTEHKTQKRFHSIGEKFAVPELNNLARTIDILLKPSKTLFKELHLKNDVVALKRLYPPTSKAYDQFN